MNRWKKLKKERISPKKILQKLTIKKTEENETP